MRRALWAAARTALSAATAYAALRSAYERGRRAGRREVLRAGA